MPEPPFPPLLPPPLLEDDVPMFSINWNPSFAATVSMLCATLSADLVALIFSSILDLKIGQAKAPKKFWKATLKNIDTCYRNWVHIYEAKCEGGEVMANIEAELLYDYDEEDDMDDDEVEEFGHDDEEGDAEEGMREDDEDDEVEQESEEEEDSLDIDID